MTPVETLDDPPVLQRRRGADRRATDASARPARARPGELLPDQWRGGWLVFDDAPTAGPHGDLARHEMRRLAPIPPAWESCSEAELVEYLARAEVSRRSGGEGR